MSPSDLVHIARRIMMTVRRGRVKLVDDTGAVQRAQVDLGPVDSTGASLGLRDKTPHLQHFGLVSNPPVGSDIIVLAVGGDLANAVAIASNHQTYRPTGLQPGDVCLYDIRTGQTIVLNAEGVTITDQHGQVISLLAAGVTAKDRWNQTVALSAAGVAVTDQWDQSVTLESTGLVLKDRWGQTVTQSATGVTLQDQWGNEVAMAEGQMTLQHTTHVIVEAPSLDLGGIGGAAVARVGDTVLVGSSHGTITGGSSSVKSV